MESSSHQIDASISRFENGSLIKKFMKYRLLVVVVFWVIGLLVLGISAWTLWEQEREVSSIYDDVTDAQAEVWKLSIGFNAVACVFFITTFIGCLGIVQENSFILRLYVAALSLLVVGEVVLVGLSFFSTTIFKHLPHDEIHLEDVTNYKEGSEFLVDQVQREFHCCGVTESGYLDWILNPLFNCSNENPSLRRCSVPSSCCKEPFSHHTGKLETDCGNGVLNQTFHGLEEIFTEGCTGATKDYIRRKISQPLFIIAGLLLILVIPQVFVAVVVFLIMKWIIPYQQMAL
ncbi:tetraspanin-17-like [Tachypleus tridentatus]|uniref:tetraspanin-17-like n=1 Tax=Tachypleus tridentatus TaxID=6853 RepID=UPI003FD1BDB8